MKQRLETILVVVMLCFFAGMALLSNRHKCATVDEFAHLPAGYYYWLTGDFSLYPKNPPLVKLIASLPLAVAHPVAEQELPYLTQGAWRPWVFGTWFMRQVWPDYTKFIFMGRLPVILLSVLLGFFVYLWSSRLYGKGAGLVSLFCFCLSPNMLAHGRIATVDMGFSLFIFAATFTFFQFLRRPGPYRALAAGVCLGLAQLSKFTALFWIIFFIIFTLAVAFRPSRENPGDPHNTKSLRRYLVYLVVILTLTWVITCAGYGFKGLFKPTSEFTFYSVQMNRMQSFFSGLPAPLPETYLQGLDRQMLDIEKGEFKNYVLGHWYRGHRWYYFLVAAIFKVPIPFQIMFLIALFAGRRIRAPGPGDKKWPVLPEELGLLFIILVISGIFSVRSSIQIGIRYLLPLFPFAFVLMGRLATIPLFEKPKFKVFLAFLGVWIFASNLFIYPHYLSYFNELCLGPRYGHKILLDSNLDWGQDLPGLAEYIKENNIGKIHLAYFGHVDPKLYGIDYDLPAQPPVHEYTAISAQLLFCFKNFRYPPLYHEPPTPVTSTFLEPYLNQKPATRIGYSIYVYKNPDLMSASEDMP